MQELNSKAQHKLAQMFAAEMWQDAMTAKFAEGPTARKMDREMAAESGQYITQCFRSLWKQLKENELISQEEYSQYKQVAQLIREKLQAKIGWDCVCHI